MRIREHDLRYTKTKKRILNAMIVLVKKKGFDSVTVKDICTQGEISRSAFYLHYEDKFNLVEEYQKEMIKKINHLVWQQESPDMYHIFLTLLYFFKKEGELLAVLISKQGAIEVQEKMKKRLKANLAKTFVPRIKNIEVQTELEKQYLLSYLCGAQLGILQDWINQGQKESPEELAQIIANMNTFDLG